MYIDFTREIFRELLVGLQKQAFSFLPYNQFILSENVSTICLRHDVDLLPLNSLEFARIQYELGICGTYYFRAVPGSWNEKVIKEIHELGHEIGYHYECLTTTSGDKKSAITDFERNLVKLRKLVPVNTICMHGSPRSKYDSRELWKHYDYRDYGIIGEPYFDTDFNKVAYYTDTGRMWDGSRFSVRDKIFNLTGGATSKLDNNQFPTFHSTMQMIEAIQAGIFPNNTMLTFHPQRWTNQPVPWVKEYIWQNVKNVIKLFFINRKA
ncbi:MAG: hypothetical protein P1P88_17840 [Bacteroidales bacterium]|nr:hypothetical protein [Bacteroidales bacterium]